MQHTIQKLLSLIAIGLLTACGATEKSESIADENALVDKQIDSSLIYFGQKRPALTPQLFAPGIISKSDRHEFGCTISENGREVFFGVDNEGKMEIYHTRLEEGEWTLPKNLFKEDTFSHNDPMLSFDENRLYFISDRPLMESGNKKDIDIWYVDRRGENWSEPINMGPIINGPLDEYFVSFTREGALYFASRDKSPEAPRYAFDIYRAENRDGAFATPMKLPEAINTDRYEADVFIAPDESYLIFCSIRKDGLGQGDLYISFRKDNGTWVQAVNMVDINTGEHELCPFVSRDGRYLFFTSNQDIYWVSTEVLEKYRSVGSR